MTNTSKQNDVHISSLVVQVLPVHMQAVIDHINAMEGAEVNITSPEGKLVVLMETDTQQLVTDHIEDINTYEGVVSTALVYHQTEESEALNDTLDINTPIPA